MWYSCTKGIITSQGVLNNDKFRRFCEFQIENILLSHKFFGKNRSSCTIVILTVQQILLKRLILSKGGIISYDWFCCCPLRCPSPRYNPKATRLLA